MESINIKVTQECINEGMHGAPLHCPIALAVKSSGLKDGFVSKDQVFCKVPSPMYTIMPKYYNAFEQKVYNLPDEAKAFIIAFDTKGVVGVVPFEFCAKEVVYT